MTDGITGSGLEPTAASTPSQAAGVRSVDRAFSILDALGLQGGEATLSEIARRTGLNISTCHHLIKTLSKWGCVARVAGTRSYCLGSRILFLGRACKGPIDMAGVAQGHLDAIGEATGEAVQLAIMQHTDLVMIARRAARHEGSADLRLRNEPNAAHATAVGKAILAWLPEGERDHVLTEKGMTAFTPKTITRRETLEADLRRVRGLGFAVDHQEFQPGIVSIGAAVRDPSGHAVGAIGVSVPLVRATDKLLEIARHQLLKATQTMSLALGRPDIEIGRPASRSREGAAKPLIKGRQDAPAI